MPNVNIDLYDDAGETILTTIQVICTEPEAEHLEHLAERMHWHARHLPLSWGHNLRFRQFQMQFLDAHHSLHSDYEIHV